MVRVGWGRLWLGRGVGWLGVLRWLRDRPAGLCVLLEVSLAHEGSTVQHNPRLEATPRPPLAGELVLLPVPEHHGVVDAPAARDRDVFSQFGSHFFLGFGPRLRRGRPSSPLQKYSACSLTPSAAAIAA